MLLQRLDPEARGKLIEDPSVFLGSWSRKCIREPVVRGADPGRLGPVIVSDLVECTNTSHAEAVVERCTTPAKQVVTTLIVGFNCDVRMSHSRAPNPDNQHVRQQFKIIDMHIVHVRRRGH